LCRAQLLLPGSEGNHQRLLYQRATEDATNIGIAGTDVEY